MHVESKEISQWGWRFKWFGWRYIVWLEFQIRFNPPFIYIALFGLTACYTNHVTTKYTFIE